MQGYLRHMANFAYIVEIGSLTGAAKKLDCSPSAMSDSVKILETHFKQPLLERHQNGVRPNSKGAEIYEDCRAIVRAGESVIGSPAEPDTGTVKVSLPSEFLQSIAPQLIKRITWERPGIRLVLAGEDDILDHTKFARDLYVRVDRERDHQNLTTIRSNPESVVLVGSRTLVGDADLTVPDVVASFALISGLLPGDFQTLPLVDPETKLEFRRTLQVGSTEARLSLMRTGLGLTACLKSSVAQELSEGSLVQVLPDRFGFPMQVTIGSPHRSPPPLSSYVAEVFAEVHNAL